MIRIRGIKTKIEEKTEEDLKKIVKKKYHLKDQDILEFHIVKQSLDARSKEKIHYVNVVDLALKQEASFLKKYSSSLLLKAPHEEYVFPSHGQERLLSRPIIVGSGPAGLFAAYLLAEEGYCPLIIERGEKIEERVKTVERFFQTGKLNENSNVQFGEGGAGTFSDGKLNTTAKDKFYRKKKILEIFVACGAEKEILYQQNPHIGTDLLRKVIIRLRQEIMKRGGEFWYNTCLTDLIFSKDVLEAIEVNHRKKIPCSVLVLAIGHSARDTFQMLYEKGITMEAKPFAVGIRIEHPQAMINQVQYREKADKLPPASYKLTYTTTKRRGVYSFCMCPGGYVINASSEKGYLAINGMSYQKRDSKNANSALVVTVTPKDFGDHPLAGLSFQRKLEALAYQQGQGKIPMQLWKDYRRGLVSTSFGKVEPLFLGAYQFADLNKIFPSIINESLKEAIPAFGEKIPSFDREDALLAGVESRTSSPVHIPRDEKGEANKKGIYPCGEGAGYAGGIMTSAMDGMFVAEQIGKRYSSILEKKN